MWDEIIYPFPYFNAYIVEIWQWVSNFIPHFVNNVMTYTCLEPQDWMLNESYRLEFGGFKKSFQFMSKIKIKALTCYLQQSEVHIIWNLLCDIMSPF